MQLNEQEQNSPVDVNALAFVSCSCVMVSAQVVVSGWMDGWRNTNTPLW